MPKNEGIAVTVGEDGSSMVGALKAVPYCQMHPGMVMVVVVVV